VFLLYDQAGAGLEPFQPHVMLEYSYGKSKKDLSLETIFSGDCIIHEFMAVKLIPELVHQEFAGFSPT